jgi:hypothetical protein
MYFEPAIDRRVEQILSCVVLHGKIARVQQ